MRNHQVFLIHTQTHVFGTLLLELASMQGDRESVSVIGLEAVAEAIPSIERAMQVIGARGSRMRRYEKDLEMLTSLQKRLLDSVTDVETLKEYAKDIFDSNRSQIGFEVVARKLLYDASESNRGRSYLRVKEYLDECLELCKEKGIEPKERMIAVRVDLYVRWQIQRTGGQVDWGVNSR